MAMVSTMTNRLLSVVIAFALTSGIVAHAAQAPLRPLAPTTLPSTLETAVSHLSETASAAIDPSAAIRDAYQRDHVALEHLRQQASALKGSGHPAFNNLISNDEATLIEMEKTALATSNPAVSSTVAAMDALVSSAEAALAKAQSQPRSQKPQGKSDR